MRKILSCICLVAVGAWFTACDDDDDKKSTTPNEFNLGDQKYALAAGYYDSVSTQTVGADTYHFWNVVVTSSGITYSGNKFVGTGDAVRFDLYTKQDGELPNGTYTASSLENGIENARIFITFNPESGTGTTYTDEVDDAEVTITKSGSTHTVTFTITLEDAREIKGTFAGTLTEVSNF